jgi:light-harvesting complex II chlorophyll a/b binding protein 4
MKHYIVLTFLRPRTSAQVGLDQSDINKAVNKAGNIVGKFNAPKVEATGAALSPYSEVFGLQRFRETELIHGRSVHLEHLLGHLF